MSESTAAVTSSASVYTTRGFWEPLWRTAGLQFVAFSIVAYLIYGNQRAMLIMAGTFGLWRAGLISNARFAAGVAALRTAW